MNASFAARFLSILFTVSLKASLVFLVVYLAARLLRDSLPHLRHMLWLGAIFSHLIILLLSLFGPALPPMQMTGPATRDGISRTVSEVLLAQGVFSVTRRYRLRVVRGNAGRTADGHLGLLGAFRLDCGSAGQLPQCRRRKRPVAPTGSRSPAPFCVRWPSAIRAAVPGPGGVGRQPAGAGAAKPGLQSAIMPGGSGTPSSCCRLPLRPGRGSGFAPCCCMNCAT